MLTNDVLDLVSDNVDVALRIGASNPKDALSRGALDMRVGLYPSAGYLGTHGTPQAIGDIATLIGPQRAELRRLLFAQLPGRRGASRIRYRGRQLFLRAGAHPARPRRRIAAGIAMRSRHCSRRRRCGSPPAVLRNDSASPDLPFAS